MCRGTSRPGPRLAWQTQSARATAPPACFGGPAHTPAAAPEPRASMSAGLLGCTTVAKPCWPRDCWQATEQALA